MKDSRHLRGIRARALARRRHKATIPACAASAGTINRRPAPPRVWFVAPAPDPEPERDPVDRVAAIRARAGRT